MERGVGIGVEEEESERPLVWHSQDSHADAADQEEEMVSVSL